MRLFDGKKLVEIKMRMWDGANYSPDWSIDFFDAGLLHYDGDIDAHLVPDVDYCIEQAYNWKNGVDYIDDPDDVDDTDSRDVDVTVIE